MDSCRETFVEQWLAPSRAVGVEATRAMAVLAEARTTRVTHGIILRVLVIRLQRPLRRRCT